MNTDTILVKALDILETDHVVVAGRICKVARKLNMRHYVNIDLQDIKDEYFEIELRVFPHEMIEIQPR